MGDKQHAVSALPFVLPLGLYLALTNLAAGLPALYPWLYAATVFVLGTALMGLCWGRGLWRPHARLGAAIVCGLVGLFFWVLLSRWSVESGWTASLPAWLRPTARVGFDPFTRITHPAGRAGFVAIRVVGLAVVVPIAEELFWRGFLWRWIISPNWWQVRPGRMNWRAFCVVTLAFTAVHPEWLAAACYCLIMNALWVWKRDLWDCIVAHGVSNLGLAVYVLASGSWWLW